jgi:hypothetical protein
MDKKILTIIISLILIVTPIMIYLSWEQEEPEINKKPVVEIIFPLYGSTVSKIAIISGTAFDPDGDDDQLRVDVYVDNEWVAADGNTKWSYEWRIYDVEDGLYTIRARSFDGISYSKIEEIKLMVNNPETVETDSHKWAVFIIASNFPMDNESKLGNGALNLAENMAEYFITNYRYSTSNIFILFDDGWIRSDNGYGDRLETLMQRDHKYDFIYAGATKNNVLSTLQHVVETSNRFNNSEVFIWVSSHGCGDNTNEFTGGKILERSAVFLWDDILSDDELGTALYSLKSKKTCVIVDACYTGGFADKTIYSFPEFFILRSKIPKTGRVVITGTSKYRKGYASTIYGPLFTLLWFEGITTGKADGFRPGLRGMGRPTILRIFKDGKVSVEEAFYYARYTLKNSQELEQYNRMEPQINDQFPRKGTILSRRGLNLGE